MLYSDIDVNYLWGSLMKKLTSLCAAMVLCGATTVAMADSHMTPSATMSQPNATSTAPAPAANGTSGQQMPGSMAPQGAAGQYKAMGKHPHHMRGGMSKEQMQQFRQKMVERWQSMTPEQKQQIQQGMQKRWQAASPAEQKMVQEQMLMKIKSMSPAQQKQLMEQLHSMKSQTPAG